MRSRNIASAAGAYIKQTVNITQNNSAVKRVFVASYLTPALEIVPVEIPLNA